MKQIINHKPGHKILSLQPFSVYLNPMPFRKLIQSRQRARGEGDITLLRREDSLINFTCWILQLNNGSQSKTRG